MNLIPRPELIECLLQSSREGGTLNAEAFTEIMKRHVGSRQDFSHHNFEAEDRYFDGEKYNFSMMDLSWTRFKGARLRFAVFFEALLSHTHIIQSNCDGANFEWTRCYLARFDHSNLTDANFRSAGLWSASFKGACLTNASFREADIVHSDFTEVKGLESVDFTGAKFLGVTGIPDQILAKYR